MLYVTHVCMPMSKRIYFTKCWLEQKVKSNYNSLEM